MIEESSEYYFDEFIDDEDFLEFSDSYDNLEIIDDDFQFVENDQNDFYSGYGSEPAESILTGSDSQNSQNEEILLFNQEDPKSGEDVQDIYGEIVKLNSSVESLSSEISDIKENQIIMGNNNITYYEYGLGIICAILGGLVASSLLRNIQ